MGMIHGTQMKLAGRAVAATVAGAIGLAAGAVRLRRRARRIDLAGRVVVVTGGGRGLGYAIAREFLRHGCKLAIGSRDGETIARATAEFRLHGADVFGMACDASDPVQVREFIAAVLERFNGIDILVNNAGIQHVAPVEEFDEQSADAHATLAIALWWQKNWLGAERELRRALTLDPGSGRGWLSLLLAGRGRIEEAVALMERSMEQNPFSDVGRSNYGYQLYIARNYDAAIEQQQRALEINPSWQNAHRGLALAYAQKRMIDEAIRSIRAAVELAPDNGDIQADLAYVLALGGKREEALSALRRAKEQAWEGFTIARAHVALGEVDSAFAWLERSSWTWPHRAIRSDPALDPLREDPRFTALSLRIEREMGLR